MQLHLGFAYPATFSEYLAIKSDILQLQLYVLHTQFMEALRVSAGFSFPPCAD